MARGIHLLLFTAAHFCGAHFPERNVEHESISPMAPLLEIRQHGPGRQAKFTLQTNTTACPRPYYVIRGIGDALMRGVVWHNKGEAGYHTVRFSVDDIGLLERAASRPTAVVDITLVTCLSVTKQHNVTRAVEDAAKRCMGNPRTVYRARHAFDKATSKHRDDFSRTVWRRKLNNSGAEALAVHYGTRFQTTTCGHCNALTRITTQATRYLTGSGNVHGVFIACTGRATRGGCWAVSRERK